MKDYTEGIEFGKSTVYQDLDIANQSIDDLGVELLSQKKICAITRKERDYFKRQLAVQKERMANDYIRKVSFKREMALHLMKSHPELKRSEVADLCCMTELTVNQVARQNGITKYAKRKSSN